MSDIFGDDYYKKLFASIGNPVVPGSMPTSTADTLKKFSDDNTDKAFNLATAGKTAPFEGAPVGTWIPNDIADTFKRSVADSDNPVELENKLNSAYMLSQMKGISFEEAFKNHDDILAADYGTAMSPKTWYDAVSNTWKATTIQNQASKLASQLLDRWHGNYNDIVSDPLYQQIIELNDQMPPADVMKRSVPTQFLKAFAQLIPSVAESSKAGNLWGMAGMILATGAAAAAGITAAPAIGIGATVAGIGYVTLPSVAFLSNKVFSTIGASIAGMNMERGQAYLDMINYRDPKTGERVNPTVAATFATIYGGVSGLIEGMEFNTVWNSLSGIGSAKKRLLSEAVTSTLKSLPDAAQRAGTMTRILNSTIGMYGKNVASETLQETLQEGAQIWATDLARQVTNKLENTNIAPISTEEVKQRIVDTIVTTAMGSAILGGAPTVIDLLVPDVNKTTAEKKPTIKPPTAMPKESTVSGERYDKYAAAAMQPVPAGTIFQAKEFGDGFIIRAGDSKKKELSHLTYEADPSEDEADTSPGTITITGFAPGKNPAIDKALVLDLAKKYSGWNIEWEAQTPDAEALKLYLEKNNPRGTGVQWYTPEIDTPATLESVKSVLQTERPDWTPEQVDDAAYIVKPFAVAFGMKEDELISQSIAPKVLEPGMIGGNQQGVFGAAKQTTIDGLVKTVIDLAPNANPATFTHEITHAFMTFGQNNRSVPQIDEFMKRAESVFGVENGNWQGAFTGWTENYKYNNKTAEEAFAYALEDYITTGVAPTPESEGFFQRMAKFLYDLYQSVKQRVTLTPEITKFYDDMFTASPVAAEIVTPAKGEASDTVLNQYAGERANLDKIEKQNLTTAQAMSEAGKDPEIIRLATGWFKGKYDNKWRTEISDKQDFHFNKDKMIPDGAVPLSDVLQFKALFDKYPQAENIRVAYIDEKIAFNAPQAALGYDRNGNKYLLINKSYSDISDWLLSQFVVHELQHWIQDEEGFAKGSNTTNLKSQRETLRRKWDTVTVAYSLLAEMKESGKALDEVKKEYEEMGQVFSDEEISLAQEKPIEELEKEKNDLEKQLKPLGHFEDKTLYAYYRTAGEIESRDVEKRYGLSDTQRKSIAPYSTEDIAHEDAIVLFQGGTDTPAFKEWFGDSKVVDSEGKPLVVYHGSPDARDIVSDEGQFGTIIKRWKGKDPNEQYFFAKSRDVARTYADDHRAFDYQNAEPGIIPAYLSLKNPLEVNAKGQKWGGPAGQKSIIEQAKKDGHDGIIIRNTLDTYNVDGKTKTDVYVVFSPTQIKSVNNRGTWDQNDPRILYQGEASDTVLNQGEENNNYRSIYPKVRGGWTKPKILNALRGNGAKVLGTYSIAKEAAKFKDAKEFSKNIYYHGTANIIDGAMKPSITFSDRKAEQMGGGGYGQKYWGISLTKAKRTAEAFSGSSASVNVYPVLLKKNAVVKEMPEIQDSADLDDHIEKLWDEGVDAVWIGGGEQELVVLNPKAIAPYKYDERFEVYGGFKSTPMSEEQIQATYNQAKSLVDKYNGVPRNQSFRESIAQEEKLLFQGEAIHNEVKAEAQHFAEQGQTMEQFIEYMETPLMENERLAWNIPDLSPEAKQAWYREAWDAAISPALETEPSIAEWVKGLAENNYAGVRRLLSAIWEKVILAMDERPEVGADPEEIQASLETKDAAAEMRAEIAEPIIAGALAIGAGRNVSTRFLSTLQGIIKANPEAYARIAGDIMGDKKLSAIGKKAESAKNGDINEKELGRMTISQRTALGQQISDEKLSKAIISGEVANDEVSAYVKKLKAEARADKKRITALEGEVKASEAEVDANAKTIGQGRQERKQVQDELKKIITRIDKLVNAGKEIPAALESQRVSIEKRLESTSAKLIAAQDWIEIENQLQKEQRRADFADLTIQQAKAKGEKASGEDIRTRQDARDKIAELTTKLSVSKDYKNNAQIQTYLAKLEERTALQDKNRKQAASLKAARELSQYKERLRRQVQRAPGKAMNIDYQQQIAKLQEDAKESGINKLSIRELETLATKIMFLREIGNSIQRAKNEDYRMQIEADQATVSAPILESPQYEEPSGLDTTRPNKKTFLNRVKEAKYSAKNARRFIRDVMDGGVDGPNVQRLHFDKEKVLREQLTQQERRKTFLQNAILAEGKNPADFFSTEIIIPEAGPQRGDAKLTKDDLMSLELAFRNEDSRQAILYGEFFSANERKAHENDMEWFENEGEYRFGKIMDAIDTNLTSGDFKILEAYERDSAETAPRLSKIMADVYNQPFKVVEHYYGIIRKGATAKIDEQMQMEHKGRAIRGKAPPRKGFTKERVKIAPWNQTPVKMGLLNTVNESIDRQEHLIAYAKYVHEIESTYRTPTMEENLRSIGGDAAIAYLYEYIDNLKNPQEMNDRAKNDGLIRFMRGNVAFAALAFRTASMMTQITTSIWPAMQYSGPIRLVAETAKMMANPIAYLHETEGMSIRLRARAKQGFDVMQEAIKSGKADTKLGKGIQKVESIGMLGLELVDRFSVSVGWRAIYDRYLDEFDGDEQKALEMADDKTMMTQPSSFSDDLAPMFQNKSGAMQIILQFQSSLNVIFQNIAYDMPAAVKSKNIAWAIGIVTSYALAGILLKAVKTHPKDDETPEEKAKRLFFWSTTQATDSIPLIGEIATNFTQRLITGEKAPTYPDSMFPGVQDFFDGLSALTEGDMEKAGKEFLNSTVLLGVPVQTIKDFGRLKEGDYEVLLGRPRK